MTPATSDLDAAGIVYTLHEYHHDDDDGRGFGLEAADKLGLDPDSVFKTLVVTVDGEPAVAIVPVSCRLALKSIAKALGGKRAEMCDPTVAERITGFVRGGISPFGQKKRLPTVIDEMATTFDTIYVSGGRRGVDLGVSTDAVIAHLGAVVADIAT